MQIYVGNAASIHIWLLAKSTKSPPCKPHPTTLQPQRGWGGGAGGVGGAGVGELGGRVGSKRGKACVSMHKYI